MEENEGTMEKPWRDFGGKMDLVGGIKRETVGVRGKI